MRSDQPGDRVSEAALRESEDRYRDLVESSHDLIYTHTLDGTLLSVNETAVQVTGFARDHLVGMTLDQLLDPTAHQAVDDYLRTVRVQGQAKGVMKVRAASGESLHWEFRNSLRLDGPDGPIVRGIARDITDRLKQERALRASEQKYSQLVTHIHDALLMVDREGRAVFANRRFRECFGIGEEAITGLVLEDWVAADWCEFVRNLHGRLVRGDQVPSRVEYEGRHQNGRRVWLDVTVVPVVEKEQVVGTQSTFRDITDRKRHERLLTILATETAHVHGENLLSEMALRAAVHFDTSFGFVARMTRAETGMICTLFAARDGVRLPSVARMLTIPELESIGPDALPGTETLLAMLRDLLGEHRGDWVTSAPLRGTDGETVGLVGVAHPHRPDHAHDVDQALRLLALRVGPEMARSTMERRFADLFHHAADGILLISPSGKIVDANRQAERIFGYSPGELVGHTVESLIPPDRRDRHRAHASGETGQLYHARPMGRGLDIVGLRQDGSTVPVDISLGPIASDDVPMIVASVRDRTSELEAQRQRRQLETQLQNAQKLEAVGTLAGGIAHDFNNLLASMLGNIDLALSETGPASPIHASLREVKDAGHRALEVVSRLLALGGRRGGQRELHDLTSLVRATVLSCRARFPDTVTLSVIAPEEPVDIHADSVQLDLALTNVITNAGQALTPAGGRITVTITSDSGRTPPPGSPPNNGGITITVSDTGPGIPPSVLPRVLEPFFTTRPPGEGSGLGLSVAHRIVADHEGALTVTSVPGQGTAVLIRLPSHTPSGDVRPRSVTRPPLPSTRSAPLRVMYIDDEEQLSRFIEIAIQRAGHQVRTFTRPADALDALRDAPGDFDFVVTDASMPVISGLDVARAVTRIRPSLPVVLVSGDLSPDLLREAKRAGVTRVLQKPFRLGDLLSLASPGTAEV